MTQAERALLRECAYALASVAQFEGRLDDATVARMDGAAAYVAWQTGRVLLDDGKGRVVLDEGRMVLSAEQIMSRLLSLAGAV